MNNIPDTIDNILIIKHQRLMFLRNGETVIKTYAIALGKNPIGPKEFEGDHKTPEGKYLINDKNEKSEFYKNLGVSYPNQNDIDQAQNLQKPVGGLIKIHGFKNDFMGDQTEGKKTDWTAGCIAVTNQEMDEIFEMVEIGTEIIIEP
jgi:murein L,D-transpeptidase YafK